MNKYKAIKIRELSTDEFIDRVKDLSKNHALSIIKEIGDFGEFGESPDSVEIIIPAAFFAAVLVSSAIVNSYINFTHTSTDETIELFCKNLKEVILDAAKTN